MLTNAKVYTILSILAIGGLTIFSVYSQKDTSIDSIRVQAQEARQREIEARIDRETTEDTLSLALRTQCDSQALTLTGIRYEEKQRKGYECWREELKKTNT